SICVMTWPSNILNSRVAMYNRPATTMGSLLTCQTAVAAVTSGAGVRNCMTCAEVVENSSVTFTVRLSTNTRMVRSPREGVQRACQPSLAFAELRLGNPDGSSSSGESGVRYVCQIPVSGTDEYNEGVPYPP